MNRCSARLIIAAIASAAMPAAVVAQTAPPADTTPPPTPTPTTTQPAPPPAAAAPKTSTAVTVNDEQIRSFALALVQLDKIQRHYQPQIKAAGESERPALKQKANAAMTAAVEAQGLDPQAFNAISTTAKENPELRSKIRAELAKVRPSAPAGR